MAMKVVRQARLELSGGSTPDQLRPPPIPGYHFFFSGGGQSWPIAATVRQFGQSTFLLGACSKPLSWDPERVVGE